MSYEELALRHRRLSHLQHVEAIVGWDEAVMMPEGGGASRADALSTLRVIVHQAATAPELGDLFAAAEEQARKGGLTDWQRANLREMKRSWIRETCLPASLVEASSQAELRSEQAWRKLRGANDWNSFRPLLEQVVALKREVASALADKLQLGRYDALLDGFEPGGRRARIDGVFADLRAYLPGFIQRALAKQKAEEVIAPKGPFAVERQRWLGLEAMKAVGFDFTHGRLDVSHHPFCGGVPRDVRITTRYDEKDFTTSFMGVLHETGHAKYEQGLPTEWLDQPVGKARSMSVHESQSLLQEMQVSRSRAFIQWVTPLIAQAFPDAAAAQPQAFAVENLVRLYTRVRPGYIRVDADEATYPCHIILRYELETKLVEGQMEVRDIPDAWDAGMRELLGLTTKDNFKDGCMQDVHWPAGLFGYFPTYTLGALTAAQLFAALRRERPSIDDEIARGEFGSLNSWLREKVWSRGSILEIDDLLVQATGAPLGTAAFKAHLERRYL